MCCFPNAISFYTDPLRSVESDQNGTKSAVYASALTIIFHVCPSVSHIITHQAHSINITKGLALITPRSGDRSPMIHLIDSPAVTTGDGNTRVSSISLVSRSLSRYHSRCQSSCQLVTLLVTQSIKLLVTLSVNLSIKLIVTLPINS